MKFAFLPTIESGAIIETPPPRILAFPMEGRFEDPIRSTQPLTYYPLQMAVEKAVEYWWRVKEWELTYSIGGSFSGTLTMTRAGVVDEEGLCFPHSNEWTGSDDYGAGNTIHARVTMLPPSGHQRNSPFDDEIVDEPYYMTHELVIPALSIGIEAHYEDGDVSVQIETASSGTGFVIGPYSGQVAFDGVSLDCTYYASIAEEEFTCSILPKKWFSWGGTWDEGAGEKI